MKTMTIDGDFEFEGNEVGILAEVTYEADREGLIDYLDITRMKIFNEDTESDVDATTEQMVKFQEQYWKYLEEKCQDNEKYLDELAYQNYIDNLDSEGEEKLEEMQLRGAA